MRTTVDSTNSEIICNLHKFNSETVNTYIPLSQHSSSNVDILKADTGASSTFLKPEHQQYLHNPVQLTNGPRVHLPDNTTLTPTLKGTITLNDSLPINSFLLPGMKNESLLSIGQLCDQGCIAMFTKNNLQIFQNNKKILHGRRNSTDGLWDVPLQHKKQTINYVLQQNKPQFELAQYLHACAFSPAIDTFTKAIKNGNFISWPGINDLNFKSLLKTTVATAKGHLNQERQGLQSTNDTIIDFLRTKRKLKHTTSFWL